MQFNKISLTKFLNRLAVVLIVLFAAYAASSSAQISPVRAYSRIAEPQGSDAGCQVVLSALDKNFTTPYHMYMTQTTASSQNGKPITTEMVFAGDKRYILYDGKWTVSPMSTEEMKAMSLKARRRQRVFLATT